MLNGSFPFCAGQYSCSKPVCLCGQVSIMIQKLYTICIACKASFRCFCQTCLVRLLYICVFLRVIFAWFLLTGLKYWFDSNGGVFQCCNFKKLFQLVYQGIQDHHSPQIGAKSNVFSQSYIEKFPIAFTSLLKKTVSKPVYQNNSKNIKLRLLVEKEHWIF